MSFTYALGWTLLHSLWQGLILAVAAIVALRLIPSRYSSTRYLVSTAALGLMLVAGIFTFGVLLNQAGAHTSGTAQALQPVSAINTEIWLAAEHAHPKQPASAFDRLYVFIQSHLQFITFAWVVGVLFFSLRIAGGFWYLSRIRRYAVPVNELWTERLKQLCTRMGIRGDVMLAESAQVQSPLVMGYLKPLILIPMGMIGGLSTAQLETILLHELSHVRRADYLVNIVQSFIEAIFFFNPFVWIVSSMVRTEREHCCDDAVVRYGDALTYAQALTTVEMLRFNTSNLAMSLAGDKNQLLKRIKRIMERSVQHYSVKERIVPVILLAVGLACASWITLKPEQQKPSEALLSTPAAVAADTTKPGKSYSRKQIIRFDDQGNPHTRIIERDENGDDVREIEISEDFDIHEDSDIHIDMSEFHDFDMPLAIPAPAFDFHMEPIDPVPAMEPFEPMEPIDIHIAPMPPMDIHIAPMPPMSAWRNDTLKPGEYSFHFDGTYNDDWASFSNEFQTRFKEQFADFYKKHGAEMETMMKDMGKNFEKTFDYTFFDNLDHPEWDDETKQQLYLQLALAQRELDRSREDLARRQEEWTMEYAQRDQHKTERDRYKTEHRSNAERRREALDQAHEEIAERPVPTDRHIRAMKNTMNKFGEAIKAELVKDGYFKEDEAIKSMNWDSNGEIEINGKKIKDSDKAKYNGIHDKFFKKDSMEPIEED